MWSETRGPGHDHQTHGTGVDALKPGVAPVKPVVTLRSGRWTQRNGCLRSGQALPGASRCVGLSPVVEVTGPLTD